MDCVIPGANMKVVSKAIQALSKIGDELYLEAKKDYLSLRSANMTTTAYCKYNFFASFFVSYDVKDVGTDSENTEDLMCKIPMKAISGVFKSHGHKDKKPEYCKIELESGATKILFKFKYRHDVAAQRSLFLSDSQIIDVAYNKDSVSNCVGAPAHLFSQVLANFQMADDDISFEVTSNKALIRNYITGDVNVVKGIRSQLTVTAGEFSSFKIGRETGITFSLKPFRAAIQFAELFSLSVFLNFEAPGRPAVLIVSNPTFEANFVMATLRSDTESQSSLSSSAFELRGSSKPACSATNKANMTIQDQQALESVNWDNDFDVQSGPPSKKKDQFSEIIDKMRSGTSVNAKSTTHSNTKSLIGDERPRLSVHENNKMESDEDLEVIPHSPDSPRSKRIKNIFGRCYEATFHPAMLDLGEVLAPNSDPESD